MVKPWGTFQRSRGFFTAGACLKEIAACSNSDSIIALKGFRGHKHWNDQTCQLLVCLMLFPPERNDSIYIYIYIYTFIEFYRHFIDVQLENATIYSNELGMLIPAFPLGDDFSLDRASLMPGKWASRNAIRSCPVLRSVPWDETERMNCEQFLWTILVRLKRRWKVQKERRRNEK